jgi:hypothetical protein
MLTSHECSANAGRNGEYQQPQRTTHYRPPHHLLPMGWLAGARQLDRIGAMLPIAEFRGEPCHTT